MLERGGHTNKFVALKRLSFLILLTLCACFFGCGERIVGNIQGYETFLKDYKRYSTSESEFAVEKIEGFKPIINEYFSFGTAFSNNVSFVRKSDENYILSRDGKLTRIVENLSETSIIGGKYVLESEGRFGVKSVLGFELLPPVFSEITILCDTVLASAGEYAETFNAPYDCKEVAFIERGMCKEVSLLDESHLLADGYICDLNFVPITACGLYAASLPCEGKVVVNLDNGMLGYADLATNKLFNGAYVNAHNFSEGTAVAKTSDGETVVIDENGNKLYSSYNKRIGNRSYGFYCYESMGKYGILNAQFEELTDAIFPNIKYEQSVCGYFIISQSDCNKIYSPQLGEFVYEGKEIYYSNRLFFIKDDERVTVLDENLNKIFSGEKAEYNNGVLTVKKDNKYAYYERIQ